MKWLKPAAVAGIATATATAIYIGRGSDDATLLPVEKVKSGAYGLVRSTRAIHTISCNIADYKYSLHGVDRGSDDYRCALSQVHMRSARRILKLCETNKGFYSKAGQFIASMRQVPKEYTLVLSSLLDQAAPCDFEAIKKVLLHNLGKDISEIFVSFDEKPIAAASIAQVHHAVLKNGHRVAVKVQYPGLEDKMKIDIATMAVLSKFVSWVFPDYRFEWAITEFRKTISLELDFLKEAKNCERTSKNFRMNGVVRVPRVFWDFTRERVLTMQFFTGNKVDDVEYMRNNGINPAKVAKALVDLLSEMIFVHGFLHGDPHPGNILVSPEGSEGFSLVILDHGLYKELDDGFRLDYCRLWKALIFLDQQKIQQFGEKHGVGKYAKFFSVIFTGRSITSKSALGKGMSDEEKKVLKQELGSLAVEDVSLFLESLPSEFLVILRTDGLLRSIITKLGASQRIRLLSYFKYAAYGLYTDSNSEPFFKSRCSGLSFLAMVEYIELRVYLEIIELIFWAKAAGNSLLEKIHSFYSKLAFLFS